jgi:hypothetical protein
MGALTLLLISSGVLAVADAEGVLWIIRLGSVSVSAHGRNKSRIIRTRPIPVFASMGYRTEQQEI